MADGAKVEFELAGVGGGWTDVTADVQRAPHNDPPIADYGIPGVGPADRTASTGTHTFTLQNHTPAGYYSLEHANKRAGFAIGIGVRLSYLIGATRYYKSIGRLAVVVPSAGSTRPIVKCTAVDWMDSAARYRLTSLAMQTNKRADELITSVVAAMPDQPVSVSYDTGSETYVLSLDQTVEAAAELQKIVASEFGFLYLRGDTTGGGKLVFKSRTSRLVAGAADAAFTDDEIQGLDVPYNRDEVLNVIRAVTHPRTQDGAATTVLYQLQSTPLVTAGDTVELAGDYTDPNQRAVRVSGKDMVAPVATTDYLMNSQADGLGSNLTANFTVTAAYTGNAVFYTITNNGAVDGYITFLRSRGRGIYDFSPVTAKAISQDSIDAYGQQDADVDMPYQSDPTVGEAVAGFVRTRYSTPIGASTIKLQVIGSTAALLLQVIAREPGDRITITESQTGLDIAGFINHVRLTLGVVPTATWTIYRAEPVGYWNLEVPGYSELGLTTRLAPL